KRASLTRRRRRTEGALMFGFARLVLFTTFAVCSINFAAAADDYPNRPVRVVVGFSAGSTADISMRVIGPRMGQIIGQQIVVENKVGAGSGLATDLVARSPNDGYALLLASIANPINALVSGNAAFDFPKGFTPVVRLTTAPNILVVDPALGVKTVK